MSDAHFPESKKRKRNKKRKRKTNTDPSSSSSTEQNVTSSSATTNGSHLRSDRAGNSDQKRDFSLPEVGQGKRFRTPDDDHFDELLKNHYDGFVHIPSTDVPFRSQFSEALLRLRDANYYQYDIVMAGGQHLSRTFVRRCLVGNPGITYKYLGLRLFAHAWSGSESNSMLRQVGHYNDAMKELTTTKAGGEKCEYNLTLINYMEPSSYGTKLALKDEAFYGMGPVSVSWHADSSLQDYSDIGVFTCCGDDDGFDEDQAKSEKKHNHFKHKHSKKTWDWKIALRQNEPVKILPIVTPIRNGDVYCMVGSLNQTHQHAVLAGSNMHRISSTHRVAVTATDTYEYIESKCQRSVDELAIQLEVSTKDQHTWDVEAIVESQKTLSEVEFEWIAQYWIQGIGHHKLHTSWHLYMKTLERMWRKLEEQTKQLFDNVLSHCTERRDVIQVLISQFSSRKQHRKHWDERRSDGIYKRRVAEEFRPVERPMHSGSQNVLPKDLSEAIRLLTQQLSKCKKQSKKRLRQNKKNGTNGNDDDVFSTTLQEDDEIQRALTAFADSSSEEDDGPKGQGTNASTQHIIGSAQQSLDESNANIHRQRKKRRKKRRKKKKTAK